nr:uncharacterized protein LOC109163885 isoform X1 [Ipomoea trifida]
MQRWGTTAEYNTPTFNGRQCKLSHSQPQKLLHLRSHCPQSVETPPIQIQLLFNLLPIWTAIYAHEETSIALILSFPISLGIPHSLGSSAAGLLKNLKPSSCPLPADPDPTFVRDYDIAQQLPELKKLLQVLREKRGENGSGEKRGPGNVFLVGTGPGDPELLTLKALKVIQNADLLLYDRLVSNDVLSLVGPYARLLYVGKTAGYHSRTQITKPPFSSNVKPFVDSIFHEQDHNSQIGASLCLAAAIEATPDPDPAELRKLLPKLYKLVKNDCFKAKPSLLSLIGSIVSVGGAANRTVLNGLVSTLVDSTRTAMVMATIERTRPEEIHELLLSFAEVGANVVRLKGGDPLVFGRGGEEMDFLQQQGIEVKVIPGITAASGIAAELGIPLTHRGISNSVRFLTGHSRKGGTDPLFVAENAADPDSTLVVYMGLSTLPSLASKLMYHGLPPDTPAAAVERGTTAHQRSVFAELNNLADEIASHQLVSPTLIIIGKVVALSPLWPHSTEGAPILVEAKL